jgi:hypothetical protein
MPRKDPHTGCTVMTMGEFFNAEAEREGKGRSGAEVMSDMFDEIDQSFRDEEKRWRDNPNDLLEHLQTAIKEYNEADAEAEQYPLPTSIAEVLELKVDGSFRTSKFHVRARCTKEDGTVGILSFSSCQYSGSMSEPPDYDCEVKWEF